MNVYKRNSSNKLLFRRIALIAFILIIIYLLKNNLNDYALLFILITAFLSVFPVMAVSINNVGFQIKKYYLLGVVPFTKRFLKKDSIEIIPLKSNSESSDPAIEMVSDSWLNLFTLFIPKQKATIYTMIIKYAKKDGRIAQTKEHFNTKEFELIMEVMKAHVIINNFNKHMFYPV
jgi:hypothetical protein